MTLTVHLAIQNGMKQSHRSVVNLWEPWKSGKSDKGQGNWGHAIAIIRKFESERLVRRRGREKTDNDGKFVLYIRVEKGKRLERSMSEFLSEMGANVKWIEETIQRERGEGTDLEIFDNKLRTFTILSGVQNHTEISLFIHTWRKRTIGFEFQH